MNDKTVTLSGDQWASVIRLMMEGRAERGWFVGSDEDADSTISAVCTQTGITETEAADMEPERNRYVPKGAPV